MQGQGRSKEGQRLVLLTASQSQVSSQQTVVPAHNVFRISSAFEVQKGEVEQSSRSKRETFTPHLKRLV